ncbi:24485_t:CDS:2 [Gigaspora margarita]|uniref:24485_t:CDS:1 n=1 Tax=Gigaspora margarita TaxID=4874 RepID=A0ABN7VMG8_GIGMA|nr:24485_t:CDS:2 [Gigaspora margarita]
MFLRYYKNKVDNEDFNADFFSREETPQETQIKVRNWYKKQKRSYKSEVESEKTKSKRKKTGEDKDCSVGDRKNEKEKPKRREWLWRIKVQLIVKK